MSLNMILETKYKCILLFFKSREVFSYENPVTWGENIILDQRHLLPIFYFFFNVIVASQWAFLSGIFKYKHSES